METNTTDISSAIKQNILMRILELDSTKNATATKASIPTSTFGRRINNPEDFTIKELGKIAEAQGCQLTDILSSELLVTRRVA